MGVALANDTLNTNIEKVVQKTKEAAKLITLQA